MLSSWQQFFSGIYEWENADNFCKKSPNPLCKGGIKKRHCIRVFVSLIGVLSKKKLSCKCT